MSLSEYRVPYVVVIGILALLLASPALSRLLVASKTEFFTELWILDATRNAKNYPFNIIRNQNYDIFLDIGNRLGYCAYYMIQVKFSNQTQQTPTNFGPVENRAPNTSPSLFNLTAFVADEEVRELLLAFSFDYGHNETLSQIKFYSLTLNDVVLTMTGYTINWNLEKKGFFGNLFFELWIYNRDVNKFQYHGRFVNLWLNMTV